MSILAIGVIAVDTFFNSHNCPIPCKTINREVPYCLPFHRFDYYKNSYISAEDFQ